MTLARQLISSISLIFLAALIGIEAIYLNGTKQHLQDQLESHAQDAATSLGLSLGILLSRGDNALVETVINAAFDRGHYQRIDFVGLSGDTLVSKVLPSVLDREYPHWFARLFPLTGPTAESLVSTGWRQLGRVRVTSHPRFAYGQLWDAARYTLLWLLLIYASAVIVLRLILRGVLRPLSAIEKAAEAISRRDFVTVSETSSTRELARVVAAMNSLSVKVREAFESESARAVALQLAAYADPMSGLLNRRGLAEKFESRFRDDHEAFAGAVALLQVSNLSKINEALGQGKGDELVRSISDIVGDCVREINGMAGRWTGAQFILVMPCADAADADRALRALHSRAQSAVAEFGLEERSDIHIGAVFLVASKPDLDRLIAAADEAVNRAVEKRSGVPELLTEYASIEPTVGEAQLDVVRQAISAGQVHLVGQAALALPGGFPLHVEIMGRLHDASGRQISAAEFMPLVTRHGLSQQLDRAVVGKVIGRSQGIPADSTIAVNLAARSIADEEVMLWLEGLLGGLKPRKGRFVFEISEHGILQDERAARRFSERMAAFGAAFAIDHFGMHAESLALVRRLGPMYVKLSGVHTSKLAGDTGTRFFAESLVRAARQLDVPVIAQRVENGATVALLAELGFAGYQGFVAGKPSAWPST